MASEAFVKGWAIGVALFSTYSNPYYLPICFQTTHWSWEEARRLDEAILVKRIWARTVPGTSNSLIRRYVQTHYSRGIGDPRHKNMSTTL